MSDHDLVRRMAESVMHATKEYIASHEDYSEILKYRLTDTTRKIDMVAEEALNEAILREGIAARVISEELGERILPEGKVPDHTLVFDPVDGSNNVIMGIPYFCASLAISKKAYNATFKDIDAGAVASVSSGTFYAARGEGAFHDGKKISTTVSEAKPRYAIYAYGSGKIPNSIVAIQEENCVVRTIGSIALDICMVACGSFDAVIDSRNKVSAYDIIASGLILQEAGGVISRISGESLDDLPVTIGGISIAGSASDRFHERLLKKINVK
ncbi:inositol-1-monophosphatase [Methanocella sp. CWC-04]|uniref:fructose-bisphosphatase n=1 Tax=Methanooceanicella nereidis TaxID=2052831 RepID=A0AAP2W7K6_9EURY|nr:inositol monophosphatase family protein [Methanocella sp. CWC-04]MCD1295166.1 inositol-1-monophosphatase [Methanocella sp. CWC-04]